MTPQCSVHRVPMVKSMQPFAHYRCPVVGCPHKRPDKHGSKLNKRKLK